MFFLTEDIDAYAVSALPKLEENNSQEVPDNDADAANARNKSIWEFSINSKAGEQVKKVVVNLKYQPKELREVLQYLHLSRRGTELPV